MKESRLSLWRQMVESLESILQGLLHFTTSGKQYQAGLWHFWVKSLFFFAVLVQNGPDRPKHMSPVSTREAWTMISMYLHHCHSQEIVCVCVFVVIIYSMRVSLFLLYGLTDIFCPLHFRNWRVGFSEQSNGLEDRWILAKTSRWDYDIIMLLFTITIL